MLIQKAAEMGQNEIVNAKGQITDQAGLTVLMEQWSCNPNPLMSLMQRTAWGNWLLLCHSLYLRD